MVHTKAFRARNRTRGSCAGQKRKYIALHKQDTLPRVAKKSVTKGASVLDNNDSQSKIFAVRISSESRRIYVRSRKIPMALIVALFAVPWLLLGAFYFGVFSKRKDTRSNESSTVPTQATEGPWGALTRYEFITDPPNESLTDELFPAHQTEWYFGTISRDALTALLDASGMPMDLRTRMLATAENTSDKGWIVRPADEDVLNIPATTRKTLYAELAKSSANQRQVDPFVLNPAQFNKWLQEEHISPTIITHIKKLLYTHKDSVMLADGALLMKLIPTPEERREVLNVLMRRATVMLKLSRDDRYDVDALTTYWGVGGREKEVRPMIESLYHNKSGMIIDVALFLPIFARNRLYMYPLPDSSTIAAHRYCHWSAFNFFNESPDDSFADPQKVKEAMVKNYTVISTTPRLGDIAMLFTPDSRVVHSCVYIADDLYFSKNGPSHISPWVLMQTADILNLFPAYDGLKMIYYRPNEKKK